VKRSKAVAFWLFTCAAAVFLMALVGAVTRLTESGLSIVEWKPVAGAIPPLNDADWQREFALYKHSPQYLKVNRGMTLPEFKNIFFWEWLHRLWGRMIGIIYFVPFLWFLARRRLPPESMPAFWGILALGFAQGAMGWFMVKSGLVDQPAVSHYRLAAHLMLAFLIYACLFRLGLDFALPPDRDAAKLSPARGMVKGALILAAVTMVWGAFVAGLRAGLLYNTFPTMDGHWLPPEMMQHVPVWKAFIEEPATVQFAHRVLALATFAKIMITIKRARAFHPPPRLARLFTALFIMACAQVGLGISTLLSGVNIVLATCHQAGALILLTILVWILREIPHIPYAKKGHA
jgi:cytochrome c oxidase assembly protein subunit 15